jgi:hypothetical protein
MGMHILVELLFNCYMKYIIFIDILYTLDMYWICYMQEIGHFRRIVALECGIILQEPYARCYNNMTGFCLMLIQKGKMAQMGGSGACLGP